MSLKKFFYYLLLLTTVLLHITDWFVDNVYLRILASVVLIIAVAILPIKKKANKAKAEDDSLS